MPNATPSYRTTAPARSLILAAGVAAACWLGVSASAAAQAANSVGSRMNEQVVMIAGAGGSGELQTTIFKPDGKGPFPVLVMNHGKDMGDPRLQKRDRFLHLSREFVKRGYAVVLPMRKGFAGSSGTYRDYGCNMSNNGQLQANDLQQTIDYLQTQPWSDAQHIVVAGQSYGGLATLALGTRKLPGVRGLINFSGGLRSDSGDCAWQQALVQAFSDYGARAVYPSLWFYGQNDSYFNHALAQRFLNAYASQGGHAQLVAYGPFKYDAHGMVGSRDGVKIWWPETERFLRKIGMPTAQVVAIIDEPAMPRTDYAALGDINAVPFVRERGRAAYREFLTRSAPKAFAISASGAWSWAEEGDDPVERVLSSCQKNSREPCRVYAVDDYVVWSDNPGLPQSEALATAAPESTRSAGGTETNTAINTAANIDASAGPGPR
ncbi:dienelactone hydrolase family protein [Lacisediminimonas sp.]|uniref:dienelactone hydrolase family protein n=1 Tax=Lacisediminimonas sp. TaxID=3060582 RepID=UPI0027283B64|nr:CocE/NonD family hydrolase [Lacisediminimonas sp.]MDO8300199.1 CocE/NonD family hydrolase [Lacisediminimonas sp.]